MRRYMMRSLFALAAVAVALIPSFALAQDPFRVKLTPYGADVVRPHEEIVYLSGTGTDVGKCTAEATLHWQGSHWESMSGTMVLTAANGDSLTIDLTIVLGDGEWVGTYTILDGTGELVGAQGTGDLDIVINYTAPPTWYLDGTIDF